MHELSQLLLIVDPGEAPYPAQKEKEQLTILVNISGPCSLHMQDLKENIYTTTEINKVISLF